MTGRMRLTLTLFLALLAGVRSAQEVFVKAGETVALHCPDFSDEPNSDRPTWTSNATQWANRTGDASAEQGQTDVLLFKRSLIILSSSPQHQGNYSCCQRNDSSHFSLIVYTALPQEHLERTQYAQTCFAEERCRLYCPEKNIPPAHIQNMTSQAVAWHKDDNSSLEVSGVIPSVTEEDGGVYTCTRSYLYHGRTYNVSFTVVLQVEPQYQAAGPPEITSPANDAVYYVDLGSSLVIDCQAVTYSDFDELFWLSGGSLVKKNSSFPVFYNKTQKKSHDKTQVTASLVFKSVSRDELSQSYTCKLQSASQAPSFATVKLAQKAGPSPLILAVTLVGVMLMILAAAVVYRRFKVDIALLLRDTLGRRCKNPDGKSYDAFLMCYKSDTEVGLNEDNRRHLENVLDEQFGYSVCLYDHDLQAKRSVAEGVLECVEQSRAVVLVPTSLDFGLGTDVLSEIQEALLEQQTQLVFIRTEPMTGDASASSMDTLQPLRKAGQTVAWERSDSLSPSSCFWKKLRYHLPSPRHAPKAGTKYQRTCREDFC